MVIGCWRDYIIAMIVLTSKTPSLSADPINLQTYITSIFGIKYSLATKKLRVATSSWSYATTIIGYSNTTRKIRASSPTEIWQKCGRWVTYMINMVSALRIYPSNL